jgi:hypothetical protein
MKVFLSWSGEVSHKVAKALNNWLPYVIQGVEPFLSSEIGKGERWSDVLADSLKEAQYGIICVTPYNLHKPWINFEAGALSRSIGHSWIIPFLFHVKPEELDGPLEQFQSATFGRQGVFGMIQSVNNHIKAPLPPEILERTFGMWWRELEAELNNISLISENETRAYYQWLYTREDLDIYNAEAQNKSVWIITADAGRYLDQSMRVQVVAGCRQGTQFRYFLPRSDDYQFELQKMVETCPNVAYRLFPTAEFESQAASDYVVFNPDGDGELSVLIKLPVGDHGLEYWFKTNDKAARNFVTRFRKLWEAHNTAAASG